MKIAQSVVFAAALLALGGCASAPQTAVSSACDEMMTAASKEPFEEESALLGTLTACTTAEEWVTALKDHPNAGGLTAYNDDDAHGLLDSACIHSITTPVCLDADGRGFLSYHLDDPNVLELQD